MRKTIVYKIVRYFYRIARYYYRNYILRPIKIAEVKSKNLNNKPIANINDFEYRVFSQNGEDGIIEAIMNKIGSESKYCVEFGVEGGVQTNTRYLIEKNSWNYLYMDGNEGNPQNVKKEWIFASNINSLLEKYNVPENVDIISIDVDSNDYWIWQAISEKYRPRVYILEYNASVPLGESKTIVHDDNHFWDKTNYFGASLDALVKLGKQKGYTLVGCDNEGVNSFFVRNDLINGNFDLQPIEKLYKKPNYGVKVNGQFIGHAVSEKQMIEV